VEEGEYLAGNKIDFGKLIKNYEQMAEEVD
jgi:hypothetical protein